MPIGNIKLFEDIGTAVDSGLERRSKRERKQQVDAFLEKQSEKAAVEGYKANDFMISALRLNLQNEPRVKQYYKEIVLPTSQEKEIKAEISGIGEKVKGQPTEYQLELQSETGVEPGVEMRDPTATEQWKRLESASPETKKWIGQEGIGQYKSKMEAEAEEAKAAAESEAAKAKAAELGQIAEEVGRDGEYLDFLTKAAEKGFTPDDAEAYKDSFKTTSQKIREKEMAYKLQLQKNEKAYKDSMTAKNYAQAKAAREKTERENRKLVESYTKNQYDAENKADEYKAKAKEYEKKLKDGKELYDDTLKRDISQSDVDEAKNMSKRWDERAQKFKAAKESAEKEFDMVINKLEKLKPETEEKSTGNKTKFTKEQLSEKIKEYRMKVRSGQDPKGKYAEGIKKAEELLSETE